MFVTMRTLSPTSQFILQDIIALISPPSMLLYLECADFDH